MLGGEFRIDWKKRDWLQNLRRNIYAHISKHDVECGKSGNTFFKLTFIPAADQCLAIDGDAIQMSIELDPSDLMLSGTEWFQRVKDRDCPTGDYGLVQLLIFCVLPAAFGLFAPGLGEDRHRIKGHARGKQRFHLGRPTHRSRLKVKTQPSSDRIAYFYFRSIFSTARLSLFRRHWESRFSFFVWTVVGNFHLPITGRVDLDFGAIKPSGSCALNHHVSMNLRAGHVAVDLKIDFANIDKASLGIAKLDRCFVVTSMKLGVAI
jgi:hypothetical protein